MDRLPKGSEFDYLSEKFTKGLSLPRGEAQALDRIVMFSSTCINASHVSSVMDIVLGTWRYCINQPKTTAARDNEDKEARCRERKAHPDQLAVVGVLQSDTQRPSAPPHEANPSVNVRPSGRPAWPGTGQQVHYPVPRQAVLPLVPRYLKRSAKEGCR
jgi:hypothetical protein